MTKQNENRSLKATLVNIGLAAGLAACVLALPNYLFSGVTREKDGFAIKRTYLPFYAVRYRHDHDFYGNPRDTLFIFRGLHWKDNVFVSDHMKPDGTLGADGIPDSVRLDSGDYTRKEKNTKELFTKVDQLWNEYRASLDVERITKDQETLEAVIPPANRI